MKLKTKKHLHHRRKIFHMTGVLCMYAQLYYLPIHYCWISLSICAALFIGLDLLRNKNPRINSVVKKVFGPLLRDTEENGWAGTTFLLIGSILSLALYQPHVILLSLLFLGIGDPVASWFGVFMGRHKLVGKKTLEGSAAGFTVCSLLAFAYFSTRGFFADNLIVMSLVAGIIGTLAELIPIGKLDDNLTQPLVSGLLITMLFWWQGIL